MQIFSFLATVSALAGSGRCATAQLPIAGPFALGAIPNNGNGPYKTQIVTDSAGVPVLNSVYVSSQQFTWDDDQKRVFPVGQTTYKSGKISEGSSFPFIASNSTSESGNYLLQQIEWNGGVYLVKEGTTSSDTVYQWAVSAPSWTPDGYLPEPIYFELGTELANAAIRVDYQS